jgi:hypothetical protein
MKWVRIHRFEVVPLLLLVNLVTTTLGYASGNRAEFPCAALVADRTLPVVLPYSLPTILLESSL